MASEEEELVKRTKLNLPWRENPHKLSFAKGTKMEKATGAKGMVAHTRLVAYRSKPSGIKRKQEWLVDSGSSHHVCNDWEMMWDLKQLEKQILL